MKKLMIKVIYALLLLFGQPALAGIIGDVRVTGKIVEYNRKTVSLKTLEIF